MATGTIKEQILKDFKEANRQKDLRRRNILSFLIAVFKNAEIAKRTNLARRGEVDKQSVVLSEEEEIALLRKEAKMRQEAAQEARRFGREEFAQKEEEELLTIQQYLPKEPADEELRQEARLVIDRLGAKGKEDFGRVMKELMAKLKGRVDATRVKRIVEELLEKI